MLLDERAEKLQTVGLATVRSMCQMNFVFEWIAPVSRRKLNGAAGWGCG
jgi:16S rRNA G527 N7-methylase RsmG